MALGSLQFVYHIDGGGNNLVDSMDLLNFAQGFELAEGGWVQQIPAGDNVTLIETLTFRVKATSQDDLAARLQVLDNWITRVGYYQSRAMRTAVWLRVKVAGESEYRQALITRMQYAINESAFGTLWADAKFIGTLTIVLERSAFWEEITPQVETPVNAFNYLPDVLSVVTAGDVQARIWKAVINSNVVGSNRQNTGYLGFKDDRYYDPANFYPVRALNGYEAGAGSDVTFVDDTATMGGKKLVCDFGTDETLIQRHNLPIKYVTTFDGVNITISESTTDSIRGEYLCLMKANITSTAVVRARIKIGYTGASTGDRIYPRLTISGTSPALYEMGVITLPQDRSSAFNTVLSTSIKLDAELVSGSGDLEVDSYILIPMENAVKFYTDDGIIVTSGDLNRDGIIETTPVLESYGYTTYATAPEIFDVMSLSTFNWFMPVSSNNQPSALVGAIASDDNSTLKTTEWIASISYFRRWRTLRGNE